MMMLYKQFLKTRLDLIEMNRVWEQYQKCVQDLTDNDVDHFKSRLSVDEGWGRTKKWRFSWQLRLVPRLGSGQCPTAVSEISPFPVALSLSTAVLHLTTFGLVSCSCSPLKCDADGRWHAVTPCWCSELWLFLQKVSVFRAKTGQLEVSTEDNWFVYEIKSLIYLLLLLYYLPDTGTVF